MNQFSYNINDFKDILKISNNFTLQKLMQQIKNLLSQLQISFKKIVGGKKDDSFRVINNSAKEDEEIVRHPFSERDEELQDNLQYEEESE